VPGPSPEQGPRRGPPGASPLFAYRLNLRRRRLPEDVPTAEELTTLCKHTPERWRALIMVMAWLGLRWGETIGRD
jgi:integrase